MMMEKNPSADGLKAIWVLLKYKYFKNKYV